METGLEAELPPPLRLALAHAPRRAHEPTLALFALDSRLGGFVRQGSEPLPVQMRLAWWRDTLGAPAQAWPRGDPLLGLLRGWCAPADLIALIDGWEQLLFAELGREAITAFCGGRVKAWSALAGEIGARGDPAPAARDWALGDLAANLSNPAERARVVEVAGEGRSALPKDRLLRPLAILGGLGRRALTRGGVPLLDGRMAALAALRLGMFGR